MPIGSSKLGVLGAGLVPGGTETFNAPGTFSIPPGVKKVNITGRGGTGNPGNAGNPGNVGNPGSGGAGGAGGFGVANPSPGSQTIGSGAGGSVLKFCRPGGNLFLPPAQPGGGPQGQPFIARGGLKSPQGPGPESGGAGAAGSAGSAGNTGNPGNPGQPSSGLGNTFPGGNGGNAGVAGAAGNGGTGGPGGGGGGDGSSNAAGNPGPAGTGGGAGGSGVRFAAPNTGRPPTPASSGSCGQVIGGKGGGGAGAVNSGATGQTFPFPSPFAPRPAGGTGNATAPVRNPMQPSYGMNPNTQGGPGGAGPAPPGSAGIVAAQTDNLPFNLSLTGPYPSSSDPGTPFCTGVGNRNQISQFNPVPDRPEVFRAGGGGGGGCLAPFTTNNTGSSGGGGGGGARGNVGNPGGGSPTPSGAAGTPQTFNCVPVTPGGTAPITVGSPGGQVVISWNPQ